VTLNAYGEVSTCSGTQCLGNPPQNAKRLKVGASVRVGPFRCLSLRTAMRCVVVSSGHGFSINRNGIVAKF
jgi:hypothetical protein